MNQPAERAGSLDVRDHIRAVPDFPKPGILFRDITPVMENPAAYRAALQGMEKLLAGTSFTRFAAIESRGFLFGGPLGLSMDKGMVLVRKAGKLPSATRAVTYALEYGEATIEVHLDSFGPGDRVMIVDDLLATGGTAAAAAELVAAAGATVAGFLFMVELDFLEGRSKLAGVAPVFSLVNY
jgi:adenine phosphoribosyltransferase